MNNKEIIILAILFIFTFIGYNYFLSNSETFLDIDAKIPTYNYQFEFPKQPSVPSLELSPVNTVAKASSPVQFKRTDPSGYLKNMCTYRQLNNEKNCNSIVGLAPRPHSSSDPEAFTDF